jgi:SAM-dependent methyltransferase
MPPADNNSLPKPRHDIPLICPISGSPLDEEGRSTSGFRTSYISGVPIVRSVDSGERIDFLDEAGSLPVQDSSTLTIEPIAKALRECPGYILELGAGIDICDHPRLVKTDAFVYSTHLDYVVDAHSMPFPDNTFDFVYSLAVFEHLHTPWVAAKEILRVLKPGGKVYVLTAFMQHMHGYPHHYFNMTTSGLERIFSQFEILESRPSPHCPLSQIAVTLLDVHEMASRLPGNPHAAALQASIKGFCDALPQIESDLIRPEANLEAWRRIAPGVEILARKPL